MTVHFLRSSWTKTSRLNCDEHLIMSGAAWERSDGGRAVVVTRRSLCVCPRRARDFETCIRRLPDDVTCLTGYARSLASTLISAPMINNTLSRISSSMFSSCPISQNSVFETAETSEKVACASIPRTPNLLTVHKLRCNGSWIYFLCSGAGFCALQLSNVPVWNLGSLIFAEIYSSFRLHFCGLLQMPYLPVPRWSVSRPPPKKNCLTRWHQMDVYHSGLKTIPSFNLEEKKQRPLPFSFGGQPGTNVSKRQASEWRRCGSSESGAVD